MHPSALKPLIGQLAPYLSSQSGPGTGGFQAVNLAGAAFIAQNLQISVGQAMRLCLANEIWPLRFARNRGVFSAAEQARLLEMRVAVIGCGGLGGYVISLLARAGIGGFSLCDGDVFEESNLNRQLFCTESALGQNKAEVAGRELSRIASHALARIYPRHAAPANLSELVAHTHIVVDCLDMLATRGLVEEAAHGAGLAFVHGAMAGLEGFVMISKPGGNSLRALYHTTELSQEGRGAEAWLGVPTFTPPAIALLQAYLVTQELLDKVSPAPGLWHIDLARPWLEALQL